MSFRIKKDESFELGLCQAMTNFTFLHVQFYSPLEDFGVSFSLTVALISALETRLEKSWHMIPVDKLSVH